MPDPETYHGGFAAIVTQMEGRRAPLDFAPGEGLPGADVDFEAMKTPLSAPGDATDGMSGFSRKRLELQKEFEGEPELCMFNGLLIALLRKRDAPAHTARLFERLWAEQSAYLIAHLNIRWLVSSVTTFGEHGQTEPQRRTGAAMNVLFGMMKLYESERIYSGLPPETPFSVTNRVTTTLPLEMDRYAMTSGGLDVNLLGRMWLDATEDPVIAPLACHMLEELNTEHKSLFRRLRIMRVRAERKRSKSQDKPLKKKEGSIAPVPLAHRDLTPDTLRWGVVASGAQGVESWTRFAAHHLSAGAAHVWIFDRTPEALPHLSRHPQITVQPATNALKDANSALQTGHVQWLAHLSPDDFLLCAHPLNETLAKAPPDRAFAPLQAAEYLVPQGDTAKKSLFKLSPRAGGRGNDVLEDLFPNYGTYLRGGMMGNSMPRIIARTGIPEAEFGKGQLIYDGQRATNRTQFSGVVAGHVHATSWEEFQQLLPRRRGDGSYQKSAKNGLHISDIIDSLETEAGESGVRSLFDETLLARDTLVAALDDLGMLYRGTFDPDSDVAIQFPDPDEVPV
ncbi:MAG: hypothetical protein CSA70_01555 [Rhodobacterales bacterium]|nr:MAG: hypothetical protein CSA70_01555 [Rhodobacterales bacterium]